MPVLAPDAKPEAVSVVATIGQATPVIMLHAHIDTVPIGARRGAQVERDPYGAVIHDGSVYGKGSVDDKAPLAAMEAIRYAAAARCGYRGTLVLVAAAEEEVGGHWGRAGWPRTDTCPLADFIVVGEQTHNRVATAHKGVVTRDGSHHRAIGPCDQP